MSNYPNQPQPESQHIHIPIPMSDPIVTYILLASIVIIWLLMELVGGSTNQKILVEFGANYGVFVMQGQTWRFFTSMFLHIGLVHLAFNGYALYLFGLEMERLYGPGRFLTIYLLSGLFGSLISFASRGPAVLSAGASGAIFGVIGLNMAYFLVHRKTFGRAANAQLVNILVIIGINLAFGFSMPGIDNMAHIGGLIAGFILGFALAPNYKVADEYTIVPKGVDTVSLANRWWVVAIAVFILVSGTSYSVSYWLSQV